MTCNIQHLDIQTQERALHTFYLFTNLKNDVEIATLTGGNVNKWSSSAIVSNKLRTAVE